MNKTLDERFDDGEEVLSQFDLDSAVRPNEKVRRVNVDFPQWMITKLDGQSRHLGITRQALIKTIIAERLKSE